MELQEELENILKSLVGVESVLGGLVISSEGQLLASYMPDIYDYETLADFTARLNDMVASLEALGIRQKETVFNFEGIKIVTKSMSHGHLIIMCQATVSMPLLNLSTNIVYKKISNALTLEFAPDSPVAVGIMAASSPTMTLSMKKLSAHKGPKEVKVKMIPRITITSLESELCKLIGPAAKLVVKKAISKSGGEGYSLGVDKFNYFIEVVESKIIDSKDRRIFNKLAKELTPKIKKA